MTTLSIHKTTERHGVVVKTEIISEGVSVADEGDLHVALGRIARAAAEGGAAVEWPDHGRPSGLRPSRLVIHTGRKPGLSSAPDEQITYQVWSDNA